MPVGRGRFPELTGQGSQYAQSWTDITRQEVGFAGLYGVRERQLSDDLREGNGG
jgi:hypothetical protein